MSAVPPLYACLPPPGSDSDAALREQVFAMSRTSEQLRSETAALVTALRAPHVRGSIGAV